MLNLDANTPPAGPLLEPVWPEPFPHVPNDPAVYCAIWLERLQHAMQDGCWARVAAFARLVEDCAERKLRGEE